MARTKTKRPAPKTKLANPRNEALQRMTKAELVRTVKTLDRRVTQLLNEIAALKFVPAGDATDTANDNRVAPSPFIAADAGQRVKFTPQVSDEWYRKAAGEPPDVKRFPWEI